MDINELRDWWAAKTARDIDAMLPKVAEYSASDLQVIGSGLVPHLSPALQAEAAIAFYLLGKAARLTGSFMEGKTPNVDSWDDAAVYSMMGRRVREHGGWPAGPGAPPAHAGSLSEPREPAMGTTAGVPHEKRTPRAPAPVAYLAHPIDNGTLEHYTESARKVLHNLGCTIYDPGRAWHIADPDSTNPTIHDANLAVLEQVDLLVVVLDPGQLSIGSIVEATDRGRYSPGSVVIYGPNLNPSVTLQAEGWHWVKNNRELAEVVNRILTAVEGI